MDKTQTPQFQSLQGFNKLVWGEHQLLLSQLKELFEFAEEKCFKKEDEKYKAIRILDTFLSDSFILNMIKKIIANAKVDGYRTEILLLDPFSIFAESRARALSIDAVEEINSTLFCIREAIAEIREKRSLPRKDFESKKMKPQFLFDQLSAIRKFPEFQLDIKFYELLTDTPMYLISQFIMKGFILHNRTSMKNPWMIIVDDPTQEDDLFDYLSWNFDDIWAEAKEWPVKERQRAKDFDPKNVFISHGRNELVKLKIKDYVEKDLDRKPIWFERYAEYGRGIFENLEDLTDKCSSAIIILTKEDELKSDEIIARQNVIHELGYCQAKFGRENVAVLVEKGITVPSNISGSLYVDFEQEKLDSCFYKLARHVKQLASNGSAKKKGGV